MGCAGGGAAGYKWCAGHMRKGWGFNWGGIGGQRKTTLRMFEKDIRTHSFCLPQITYNIYKLHVYLYKYSLNKVMSVGLTMIPPALWATDVPTKISVAGTRNLLLNCWSGKSKRHQNNTGYCCSPWLPPQGKALIAENIMYFGHRPWRILAISHLKALTANFHSTRRCCASFQNKETNEYTYILKHMQRRMLALSKILGSFLGTLVVVPNQSSIISVPENPSASSNSWGY